MEKDKLNVSYLKTLLPHRSWFLTNNPRLFSQLFHQRRLTLGFNYTEICFLFSNDPLERRPNLAS